MSQTQNIQCLNFSATAYQTQNTQQLKVDLRFLDIKNAPEFDNQNEWDWIKKLNLNETFDFK